MYVCMLLALATDCKLCQPEPIRLMCKQLALYHKDMCYNLLCTQYTKALS